MAVRLHNTAVKAPQASAAKAEESIRWDGYISLYQGDQHLGCKSQKEALLTFLVCEGVWQADQCVIGPVCLESSHCTEQAVVMAQHRQMAHKNHAY